MGGSMWEISVGSSLMRKASGLRGMMQRSRVASLMKGVNNWRYKGEDRA